MEKYLGVETVQAKPITRGDYNILRGWEIPADENPLDKGYLVEREGGHVNWIPKEQFNKTYHELVEVDKVEMVQLKHDLLTTKYTTVYHERDFQFNAPHLFEVCSSSNEYGTEIEILGSVHFQEGPIKEAGVNGVTNEDLIHMVICRLEHFQKSPFSSRDNELAITHLENALLRLRKRTIGRENRGVEGTNIV